MEIIATPDSGWEFGGWTGDSGATDPDISFTIDSDKHITANFTKIPVKWWIISAIAAGCIFIGAILYFSKRSGPRLANKQG